MVFKVQLGGNLLGSECERKTALWVTPTFKSLSREASQGKAGGCTVKDAESLKTVYNVPQGLDLARPEGCEWNDGDKNVGGMNEGAEAENSWGAWLRRGDKWGDSCRTRGR